MGAMALVYNGKAFRKRYNVTQAELALGAGLREATLVDIEHGKHAPHPDTVARIIAFFRARGIECEVGDLLVYQDPPSQEELHG